MKEATIIIHQMNVQVNQVPNAPEKVPAKTAIPEGTYMMVHLRNVQKKYAELNKTGGV